MERLRKKARKGKIRCASCQTSSSVIEWHKATQGRGGRLSHRLPYARGMNIVCPSCGCTVSSSRVTRTIIENGVERDGIFITE